MQSELIPSAEIAKEEWQGLEAPPLDEIVGGALYPSCVACHDGGVGCEWKFRIIGARMQGYARTEWRCERCQAGDMECEFPWGVGDSLRAIDDAVGRLAQHARSEYKNTCRRAEEHERIREALVQSVNSLLGG